MTVKSFNNIHSSNNDSLPMYQKIKEHILEKIAQGQWKPQQKIPSENEISMQLNISRMTVNRAFKELTEEGYLFREKGAGTFVAEPFQLTPFFELRPISEEIALEGNHYNAKIITLHQQEDNLESFQKYFNDAKDLAQKVFLYSEIVYFNQAVPIQFEKRYVLESFAPHYMNETFSRLCSTAYLQKLAPTLSQKHTLDAIIPGKDIGDILQLESGIACFKVTETLQVSGKIVSYAEQYYPASRYQFHSKI